MDYATTSSIMALQLLLLELQVLKLKLKYVQYLRSKQRKHRWWVRTAWRERKSEELFHTTMPRLMAGDPGFFVQCFRMTPSQFEMLSTRLSHRLQKFPRNREAISPKERISIALSFLASGACIRNIALLYRVGIATASKCINEVCTAIYEELRHEYLPAPDRQMWAQSEAGFRKQWQFPGCIGALDGKHILLQCPANSGSMFYNYKGDFSLVLMAVVDYSYRFLYVDIGAYGSQSDGGVFKASSLGRRLYDGTLDLPSVQLNGSEERVACLVGDSAFQLHKHLMKPYPTRGMTHSRWIFNYRLCRARFVDRLSLYYYGSHSLT